MESESSSETKRKGPFSLLIQLNQGFVMETLLLFESKKYENFITTQKRPYNKRSFSDSRVNGNMNTRNALIEQRRALGLCFQCGDKWASLPERKNVKFFFLSAGTRRLDLAIRGMLGINKPRIKLRQKVAIQDK